MVLFFGVEFNDYLKITIFVFISYGLLGFADDFLKIVKKNNEGLNKRQKFFGQILIAVVFYYLFSNGGFDQTLRIHTLNINISMGWLYGFFILFMLVGTSNAVNLSDGLDGLCSGLSIIAFVTYGLIAVRRSTDISEVLTLAHFSFALVGGLLGFLIYNYNPAKVFMGDVGSLSLGGALATIAILTRHELTLIIVGIVFVLETLSVIIQVISFKSTGRRVFLMSPIHHHFELLGWEEKQIVHAFWAVGLIGSILALLFGVWS
jgi:phospho-N-acetylmuramoyl-pentapeptide-transferase